MGTIKDFLNRTPVVKGRARLQRKKKIFATYTSNRGLIAIIYQELN